MSWLRAPVNTTTLYLRVLGRLPYIVAQRVPTKLKMHFLNLGCSDPQSGGPRFADEILQIYTTVFVYFNVFGLIIVRIISMCRQQNWTILLENRSRELNCVINERNRWWKFTNFDRYTSLSSPCLIGNLILKSTEGFTSTVDLLKAIHEKMPCAL